MANFNEQLQCTVSRFYSDCESNVSYLYILDEGCCDMSGCIEFFQAQNPDVEAILTFSSEAPDTVYFKDKGGQWGCHARPTQIPSPEYFVWMKKFHEVFLNGCKFDEERHKGGSNAIANHQQKLLKSVTVSQTH